MLKLTLAQLNFTIGDIEGNVALMLDAAQAAAACESELLVFSELALTGYYPGDLLDEQVFLQRVDAAIDDLLRASQSFANQHWVVGSPIKREGPGKRLANMLLVLHQGQIVLRYAKQLLPTYNVFDEHRHFEPGPDQPQVLQIGNTRVGFMICEDGWNDHGADYAINPLQSMREAAPDVVVSINASPSHVGKREQRHEVFTAASRKYGLPMVYVNQIGGHDQLVYDGASFAVEPQAGVVFEAPRFVSDVRTLCFEDGCFRPLPGQTFSEVREQTLSTCAFYQAQIILGLKDYARRCGFERVVVGSSGGIDSALTLALAVQALGADQVCAITMPSPFSSLGSVDDSLELCRNLGIQLHTHPIAELIDIYKTQFKKSFQKALQGLALENLQARIRGTILMAHSNSFNNLLLTTGNKSELSVGYCTLYGDTNGGLGLIGDLYKTEVFDLSIYINESNGRIMIPKNIIEKPPSAELAPNQKDTDSLPPYPVLDEILKILIEGNQLPAREHTRAQAQFEQCQNHPEGLALIQRIRQMIVRNEYKRRQSPPIIRLRPRAFGSGRQMPIAAYHPK
jgi:NAD+ synthase (glutamine-hydrolysing)